jgi:hypothetical protein
MHGPVKRALFAAAVSASLIEIVASFRGVTERQGMSTRKPSPAEKAAARFATQNGRKR